MDCHMACDIERKDGMVKTDKRGDRKDYEVHLITITGSKRWSGLTAPKAVQKYAKNLRAHPKGHHLITRGRSKGGRTIKIIAEHFGGRGATL